MNWTLLLDIALATTLSVLAVSVLYLWNAALVRRDAARQGRGRAALRLVHSQPRPATPPAAPAARVQGR